MICEQKSAEMLPQVASGADLEVISAELFSQIIIFFENNVENQKTKNVTQLDFYSPRECFLPIGIISKTQRGLLF